MPLTGDRSRVPDGQNGAVTILSRSARDARMMSIQCDVCLPPTMATNHESVLATTGWRMRSRGAELDVCPHCVNERTPERPRIERVEEATAGRLPNLLLIGAAKCGTTSLHAYLDSHPEIAMAGLKELRFFQDPDCADWLPWYRAQFNPTAKVAGESSTMYTRSPALPGVAERMAALIPDARLIYMVRDPVERAVASYLEERFQLLDPRPLDEAFADLDDPYNPYVSASRYAEQLRLFLEHFPRDQVMVVPLSDLQTEPATTLARIFGFVGVDDAHEVDTTRRFNEGAAKYEYAGVARQLRHSAVGRVVRRLPPRSRAALQGAARRLLSRPLERPELSPVLRHRLEEALAPDASELRALTGLALPDWSV